MTVLSKPGGKPFFWTEAVNVASSKSMPKYDFHSLVRNANKIVSMFVAELRKVTEYCEYGDSLTLPVPIPDEEKKLT